METIYRKMQFTFSKDYPEPGEL